MIAWLIYQQTDAEQNQTYIHWFIKEARKQGIDLQLVYREALSIGFLEQKPTICIHGKKQMLPHFIVNRTIEPIVQHFFTQCHIPIFNDIQTASIVNDKARTHLELQALHIPMLPTFFLHGRALPNEPPISYPLIVKSVRGRGGTEVYFIESKSAWYQFRDQSTAQEYIAQSSNVQLGKDVRVFIIGTNIVAAVLRHNERDFRANFKLGGKAIPYELSATEKEMIHTIINHFQFGLVGIDFLIDHDGNLLFNEIEDVVGSRILSETSDINLLERYVAYIKEQVNNKRKQQKD